MAVGVSIVGNSSGNGAEVDADNNLRVQVRAPGFGSLGCYQVSAISGSIATQMASSTMVFVMSWASATKFCLIKSMRVSAFNTSGATLTSSWPWALELYVARGFNPGGTIGGTAISVAGNNAKLRTSMGTSLFNTSPSFITIASNSGGMGAFDGYGGALDQFPIASIMGASPASPTLQIQFFNNNNNGYATLLDRSAMGMYPIVLAQYEALVLQTPLNCYGPSSGTFKFGVEVEWEEVASY